MVKESNLYPKNKSEIIWNFSFKEPEKKNSKQQTSVYLRHWKPDEYELGELKEEIIEGNSFEALLNYVKIKIKFWLNLN